MIKRSFHIFLGLCISIVVFNLFFFLTVVPIYQRIVTVSQLVPQNVTTLLLKQEKTRDEYTYLRRFFSMIRKVTVSIAQGTLSISLYFPSNATKTLHTLSENISILSIYTNSVLSEKNQQRYLIFFLNNKELRPGGGFIGSLGSFSIANYTISSLRIEDVYEIDGQIKTHHEPHPAVRTYLEQPNGFLRDSNFTPDFSVNVQAALPFLLESKRLPSKEIEGAIAITTTGFENFLDVVGPLYIPDFNQTLSKNNFYQTTQSQVEKNFFPGSSQKSRYLNALTHAFSQKLPKISLLKFIQTLQSQLLQKDIVLYDKTLQIENILTDLNWAGVQKPPQFDYLYPIEANVGSNKVNNFVFRQAQFTVNIQDENSINRTYDVLFQNSGNETYKNYFQLYVPLNSRNESVVLDGRHIPFNINDERGYRIIATYIEIPPHTSKKLSLTYDSHELLRALKRYSLIVQKQIGIQNYSLRVVFINKGGRKNEKKALIDRDHLLFFNLN